MATRHSLILISSRQVFMNEAERAASRPGAPRGIVIGDRIALTNGATAPAAVQALRCGSGSTFLLDLDSSPAEGMKVLGDLAHAAPVLVASESRDPDLILRAMRAGAADFLALPLDAITLAESLERSTHRPALDAPIAPRRGRVIAFSGAKGGCGATTVAVNFAVSLCARGARRGRSVILIDLDSPVGDMAAMLKLGASYSLADVAANIHRLDMDLLNSMALKHESGLRCLASSGEGSHPAVLTPDQMGAIVVFLSEHFDEVVLAGGAIGPIEMAALNQAHIVHVVTTLDFLALRRAQAAIDHLTHFGVTGDALRVVVNRHDRGSELTVRDAKDALGTPVIWSIPDDPRTAERAVNLGVPFALGGRSRLRTSFEEYVSHLGGAAGGTDGTGGNHGGLGSLIRRLVPGKAAAHA